MPYATQADIDARYPGELAKTGPMRDGALDTEAIALACAQATATVDRTLRAIGWAVPLATVPDWVTDLAVDLALYLATPSVLASAADFAARQARYRAAQDTLAAIRRGDELPAPPADMLGVTGVYITSKPRLFGRGSL